MASDNIDVTEGTGKTIATDDISDVHYQKVKLVDGTADSTTVINVDVGAKANALRVAPANDITDGTYIGDIKFGEAETNSGAIKTAVELIDNAVDGNYLNANLNIAGTDASANAGVLTAQTQRVTIATDDEVNNLLGTIDTDTGVIAGDTTSIDGKVTACNTGAVVLATGSAAIGKLAANTGVDIGDVDVTSISAGANIIGAVKRDVVNYTKVWKYVALSATTETTIWDPTGGTKFVITDIMVSASAAGTCTLRDNTAGSTIWIAALAANGGFVSNLQTPIQSATADNILTAQASATTQYVLVSGYEV